MREYWVKKIMFLEKDVEKNHVFREGCGKLNLIFDLKQEICVFRNVQGHACCIRHS